MSGQSRNWEKRYAQMIFTSILCQTLNSFPDGLSLPERSNNGSHLPTSLQLGPLHCTTLSNIVIRPPLLQIERCANFFRLVVAFTGFRFELTDVDDQILKVFRRPIEFDVGSFLAHGLGFDQAIAVTKQQLQSSMIGLLRPVLCEGVIDACGDSVEIGPSSEFVVWLFFGPLDS